MQDLIRIGVFYDGNYFLHVSNYYNYDHPRRRRLSISGLHEFIRHQIAQEEGVDIRSCQIVDAHYFRGRLSAQEASQKGDTLYWDRVFDDILMSEGVTTHYAPLRTVSGRKEEKGIDVWLAIEAFEQAFYKRFSVMVLIASDGDYVPLVRKLNTLGVKVMVLSWDFDYVSDTGLKYSTRTAQNLLEGATYPLSMHEIIDNRLRRNDPVITNLFVPHESRRYTPTATPATYGTGGVGNVVIDDEAGEKISEVMSIKGSFGFIKYPPNNLFFHFSNLMDTEPSSLQVGSRVSFTIEKSEEGQEVAKNVRLLPAEAYANGNMVD